MSRRPIIAGNWKMHKTITEAVDFARNLKPALAGMGDGVEVVICPAFTALAGVAEVLKDTGIAVGAQDVYWEESGAFTGEVSPGMLKDAGCRYVIAGHSERRQLFGETDEMTSEKFHHCVKCGLLPVLCVGETDIERNSGMAEAVIKRQIEAVFGTLELYRADRLIIIAYEPVWAIGTGKNATSSDAQKACASIREEIERTTDTRTAKEALVLYGGSVKSTNAKDYLSQSDIDGLLVGGASLDPEEFLSIIREAAKLIG
ncbi:MAG: Triosephosphate isomerase [Pelotomaculum thermopropionicum]|uniref:Triosephosphate isomerase n=1 Tax=Pelotomaculum thermopropionicum TaxID=110500 RepID=A0A101HQN4_9FIRM|nr:MAG: Triosephosphate isomerase [Pelotomaculum thermopropionicum]